MKTRCAVVLTALLIAGTGRADENKFVIDAVHSGVSFSIRYLYSFFPGRFDAFSGTIACDTNDLATMKIRAAVDVGSVHTGSEARDKHLRTKDFFDVEKHPAATFESTEVKVEGRTNLTIRGVLGLHGAKSEVVFKGQILGHGVDKTGAMRVGFQGAGTIDKTTFGIDYNSVLANGMTVFGNMVEIRLDMSAVEVNRFPEDPPAGGKAQPR